MLDTNLRQIVRTGGDEFKPYDRYGDSIAGMSWIPLSGDLQNGVFECFLLRMDPGARSKPHEHLGFEYRSGDFVRLLPGSKHSSLTPNGCTLLVMLRGNNRALSEDELTL